MKDEDLAGMIVALLLEYLRRLQRAQDRAIRHFDLFETNAMLVDNAIERLRCKLQSLSNDQGAFSAIYEALSGVLQDMEVNPYRTLPKKPKSKIRNFSKSRQAEVPEVEKVAVEVIKDFKGKLKGKVKIDDISFLLTYRLAILLKFLLAKEGKSTDKFAPWKSHTQLLEDLTKAFGAPVSEGNLRRLIYRLRKELEEQKKGYGHLIESKRRYGYRFRLKKQKPADPGLWKQRSP